MIEILLVNSSDYGAELAVWIDGRQLDLADDDVRLVEIDAGRGYSFDDWIDGLTEDFFSKFSDEARPAIEDAYFHPPSSEYIEGFRERDERYPMICSGCGRTGTEDDLCFVGEPCPMADDENDPCGGIIQWNFVREDSP